MVYIVLSKTIQSGKSIIASNIIGSHLYSKNNIV